MHLKPIWRFFLFFILVMALGTLACARQSLHSSTIQAIQKGGAFSIVSQLNFPHDRFLTWTVLMTEAGMESVTTVALEPADDNALFTKVGDSVPAKLRDAQGRFTVTLFDERRELRAVFEPDHGGFIWSVRFVLAAAGNGSIMQYWVQFTDFQDGAEEAATQSRIGIVKGVGDFRHIIESRLKPRTSHME